MLARQSTGDPPQSMPHPSAKTVDKFSDNCHKSSHSAQNLLQKTRVNRSDFILLMSATAPQLRDCTDECGNELSCGVCKKLY